MKIFPEDSLQAATLALRAMAHPLRLSIMCHLIDGPLNVSELVSLTDVAQPSLSQHLAKLRMMGIVNSERRSQNIYYQLANPAMAGVIESLKTVYCPEK